MNQKLRSRYGHNKKINIDSQVTECGTPYSQACCNYKISMYKYAVIKISSIEDKNRSQANNPTKTKKAFISQGKPNLRKTSKIQDLKRGAKSIFQLHTRHSKPRNQKQP